MMHTPLAVLGYALRQAGMLDPLANMELPIKAISHTASDKIIEALVLVLAGGRATAQTDLLLRSNRLLAQAWGQAEFAQQSTLSDTLDAFEPMSLGQLRVAFEAILTEWSASCRHDY